MDKIYRLSNFTNDLKILTLRNSLEAVMNAESSLFGKIFIQQQIIAFEIANLIFSLRYLAHSVQEIEINKEWAKEAYKLPPQTIEKLIDDNTLGDLKRILLKALPKETEHDELTTMISDYINKRNDLTHKMTTRFENLSDIQIAAYDCFELGQSLNKFFKHYKKSLNELIKKVTEERIKKIISN